MPKKRSSQQPRSIDRAAREGRTWLSKKMVLMRKKKVATLKGLMVIAFFGGAMIMLVWVVNMNVQTDSFAAKPEEKLAGGPERKFVKGELLIRFKDGVSKENQDKALQEGNAKIKDEISQLRIKRISVPEQTQDKVREALSHNPNVEFVENNALAEAAVLPNDPSYGSQWHFAKISAPQGWDVSTGDAAVPVTICDTGVDLTHPDLAGKLLPGYNFYDNNTNNADVQGHGTAVAGSAAAISNNGSGVAGVAWTNPIIPVRIADPTAWATYSAMAQCVTYGVDHGSRVINISYGGTSSSTTLQSAVDYAWSKNALVFASAGNSANNTPMYPAATNKVIGVTATNSSDNKASFSSFGTWVDIAAPGENIYTTSRGGGYGGHSGTSFASPITAGLAALVMSVNPKLSNQEAYDLLISNSDDLGAVGFDEYFGYGRINVARILTAAKNYVPQADSTTPNVAITVPTANATVSALTAVTATASDNVGVTKTELYKDGTLFATDTVSPYTFSWDTTKDANGAHSLQVKAYDAAGNVGSSTNVSVTANNIADIVAPAVTVTSPLQGAVIAGKTALTVSARATDNIGVATLSLKLDGKVIKSCVAATCSQRVNAKIASGVHSVTAEAVDGAGNAATASAITFTKN